MYSTFNPYNSRKWRKYRLAQLREQPLCEPCLSRGKVVEATECDHIKPFTEETYDELFYEWDNYQSICNSCHREITAIQQGMNFNNMSFEEAKQLKISKMRPTVGLDGFY